MNEKYTNKWYVGSDKIFTHKHYGPFPGLWVKDSEEEAINHAKKILQQSPDKDEIFIVKIVKVVRRPEAPVIIEDV